jgi:hypothetical protein
MCDYSLEALRTRLGVETEDLILCRFPGGTLGMAPAAEFQAYKESRGWLPVLNRREVPCAVCIPPGAHLLLRDIDERLQRQIGVGAEEHVVFTQTSADAWRHRDGIRFANGQEIMLQRLNEGQRATILSLSSETVEETDEVGEVSMARI